MTGRMRDRHQDHSYTERYANIFLKNLTNLLNHSQHTIHSSCISHTHLTYWSFKGNGKYLGFRFLICLAVKDEHSACRYVDKQMRSVSQISEMVLSDIESIMLIVKKMFQGRVMDSASEAE